MRVVANYSLLFICNLLCTLDLKLLNMILQFEKKEFSCYCFHFSYVWCYQARYTFLVEYILHNTFMYFIWHHRIHILGHYIVVWLQLLHTDILYILIIFYHFGHIIWYSTTSCKALHLREQRNRNHFPLFISWKGSVHHIHCNYNFDPTGVETNLLLLYSKSSLFIILYL